MWQFSGVNGVCPSGRNINKGSPGAVESVQPARYQLRLLLRIVNRSASFELTARSLAAQKILPRIVVLQCACVLYRRAVASGVTVSMAQQFFVQCVVFRPGFTLY
jgi:hypothetical protein